MVVPKAPKDFLYTKTLNKVLQNTGNPTQNFCPFSQLSAIPTMASCTRKAKCACHIGYNCSETRKLQLLNSKLQLC